MGIYYKVPISYYHLFLKKGSKEGAAFARKKLNLYKNWKRQLVLFALKFKILPTKKINSNADIVFMGNRKKEIYFDEKRIITYGNCRRDYEIRKKMSRHFNCIQNPKLSKGKLEEDLIWPTKKIKKIDIQRLFEELIIYYKKNLNSKNETLIHGDLWRGNIEKGPKNELWIFDWEFSKQRHFLWDFLSYFYTEFSFTKKINKELIQKIISLFSKSFSLKKDGFVEEIQNTFKKFKKERLKDNKEKIESFEDLLMDIVVHN